MNTFFEIASRILKVLLVIACIVLFAMVCGITFMLIMKSFKFGYDLVGGLS